MYPRMALQLNTSPRSYGFYKKFSSGPRPGCAPRMRRQCHSVLTPFIARLAGRTGQTSRGLEVGFAEPMAGRTRAGTTPALRLANCPLTALDRAGQQAADRRGTQGRSQQCQSGLALWR